MRAGKWLKSARTGWTEAERVLAADAQNLIRPAVRAGEKWADLGAGSGTFAAALSALLGPSGAVLAIDQDARALHQISAVVGGAPVQTLTADFTALPPLPPQDGLLLANSLHFVKSQSVMLERLRGLLQPSKVLIVEYDLERGSVWVPRPLSFAKLQTLCAELGWPAPKKLAEQPSRYQWAMIYSALIAWVES
ncbi:class I SAM-dependent methyltransferase [Deinococcus psychrotolerans]|uniref:Class I SAM-dependent methyltransferase n=1 Tax=Deinococcus psychrotolerans TaxID=2489213 RepID=A0A3G8YEB0_9DEIO|nr:class I SAM-dependent methyltransferase [Deinococcus psychrotolerans]AZI42567.1 class I SAM-dependent methyltransferase [Deinococcus psychrotolerans]